jgi:peptide/nickel transport system permease protein
LVPSFKQRICLRLILIGVALRILAFLTTIWLTVTVVFVVLRILSGDAIETQLLQSGASPAIIEQRRTEQGLNDPFWLQYGHYLLNLVRGNLGYSLVSGLSVNETIGSRFLPSATLAGGAILIAAISGLGIGIFTAINPYNNLSKLSSLFVTLSLSVPISWSGTLSLVIFAGTFKLFPPSGSAGLSQNFLPSVILGLHSAGPIAFVVRTNIREIMASDFVRTAYAKGLPPRIILRRHVLRAALPPIITVIFLQFGFLLSGTVVIESLFVRAGIGRLLLDSTLQHDYTMVQGVAVFIVTIYTFLNLVADLLIRFIDPRVTLT